MASYSITMNLKSYLSKLRKRELRLEVSRQKLSYNYSGELSFSQNIDGPWDLDGSNIFYDCKISKSKNLENVIACSSLKGFSYRKMSSSNVYSYVEALKDIYSISWSEYQMRFVTGGQDGLSKVIHDPYPNYERSFDYNSPVKSVMFCGSSPYMFCGGTDDGYISIWDIRSWSNSSVMKFNCGHDNHCTVSHPSLGTSLGISSVIFKNMSTLVSSSLKDREIKVWDLRCLKKDHNYQNPLPFNKFCHGQITNLSEDRQIISPNRGFYHMIMNAQQTEIYASSVHNIIYRYLLNSTDPVPLCQYTGFKRGSNYSKISLSPDDRYLFSGCIEKSACMWLTDYPHSENPQFKLLNNQEFWIPELCVSDWCQDITATKLVTCCNLCHSSCSRNLNYNPMRWKIRSREINSDFRLLQLIRLP